tara:strand:+ start:687 stop:1904 length:1218 start_codon:yes stop_codon:yes gene_type:complete
MEKSKRCIVFLGGNKESLPGIKIAIKKKLLIVVCDKSTKAPARLYADHFINSSIYKPLEIYKKIKKKKLKIDGIMSLSADVPFSVNLLANKFNLQGYKVKSSRILSDKYKMKMFFKKYNIDTPKFYRIKNFKELIKKINLFKNFVLKPVDSRGARGVFLLNKNSKNLKKFYLQVLKHSKKREILLEEFIEGDQLSTETLIYKNKAFTVGISDRNYDKLFTLSPHIIENGSDLPSIHTRTLKNKINNIIGKIAKNLGIDNGSIKGDLIVSKNKIIVVEIAGRLSGGYFSSHMIPASNGIKLVDLAINIALKEKIHKKDLSEKDFNFVTQRYIFREENKMVKKIIVPKWIKKSKNVIFFDLNIKKGSIIKKVTDHTQRIGQVIVKSKNRSKSIFLANKICKEINIEV